MEKDFTKEISIDMCIYKDIYTQHTPHAGTLYSWHNPIKNILGCKGFRTEVILGILI